MSKLMGRAGRTESDGVAAAGDRKPLRKEEANGGKHVLSQIYLGALGQIPDAPRAIRQAYRNANNKGI